MLGTVADFLRRYPQTKVTSSDVNDWILPDATMWLESNLARYFPVPFSNNNITAVQLVYRMAQVQIKLRDEDPASTDKHEMHGNNWLTDLISGEAAMQIAVTSLTSSGYLVAGIPGSLMSTSPQFVPPWETVDAPQAYPSVFDLDEPLNQQIDPNLLQNLRAARGFNTPTSGFDISGLG